MDRFSSIINQIAKENGFKNFKIIIEKGSELGYIGVSERCRIVEDEKELPLFCKFLPSDHEKNLKFNSYNLFQREVLVYKELLPLFEEFQIEHGINPNDKEGFWSYPKCYYCNYDFESPENSILIMQDLTADKFEVKDQFVHSDYEHTAKLFEELAKLHGLSLAMKQKKPETLEKFKNERNLICDMMQTDSMKHIAPRNLSLTLKLFNNEREIVEKLLPYKDGLWKQIAKKLDEAALLPHSVICHGDAWVNNILYNYHSDKRTIKDIKLVDWQIMHVGSIITELLIYLFCCTDSQVRRKHVELIQLYYDSMRQFLNKFSINIENVLSYEMLQDDLKTYGLHTFGMVNFTTPIFTKYPENLFTNENATDLTDEEKQQVKLYNSTIRERIVEMIDMNIL